MQKETWHCLTLIMDFLGKDISLIAVCLCTITICLSLSGIFKDLQVTHAVGKDSPHTMADEAFAPVTDNSLDDPFRLWHEEFDVCFFPKNKQTIKQTNKKNSWTHLTTAHISTMFWTI